MAVVRVCPFISQAVTTVWRIGRWIPTRHRFMWCGPNLCRRDTSLVERPGSRRQRGNDKPLSELTNDYQILGVLKETLKQSSGKADIMGSQ